MTFNTVLCSDHGAKGNRRVLLFAGEGAQEVQRGFAELQVKRRHPGHAKNQQHQPAHGQLCQSGRADKSLYRSAGSKQGHRECTHAQQQMEFLVTVTERTKASNFTRRSLRAS